MVTVKALIAELKKMPQHLDVGVAMHDNSDHEVAGWVSSVQEDTDDHCGDCEEGTGERCVVLCC